MAGKTNLVKKVIAGVVRNVDPIQEMKNKLMKALELKEQAKKLENEVREFMKIHNISELEVNGKKFGAKEIERITLKTKDINTIIEEAWNNNIDLNKILVPDKKNIKDLLPNLIDKITKYMKIDWKR